MLDAILAAEMEQMLALLTAHYERTERFVREQGWPEAG